MQFEDEPIRPSGPVGRPTVAVDFQLVARTIFVVAALAFGIWILRGFLAAVAWAGVLAIATWPLRERLIRKGVGPALTAVLLTVIISLLLMVPLIALAIQLAREAVTLFQLLRDARQHGLEMPDWMPQLPFVGSSLVSWWQDHLANPEGARELLGRAGSLGVIEWLRSLGTQFAGRLTILAFTILSLYFLYRDGPQLIEQSTTIGFRLFGPSAERLGKNGIAAIRATVNGLVLVGLGEGLVMSLAYLTADLTHALLFGLATGVLGTIPFGAPIVFSLASLVLLTQSHVTAAIAVLVFGVVVVFVADHFVRPVLIGNTTRLPFLWVLLAIFGGLETFGLIGVFLGPAIISMLVTIWRESADSDLPAVAA